MTFSTIDRIRDESWFTGNLNITDANIQPYLEQSNGVVLSYVGAKYNIINLVSWALFTGSQAEKMLQRCEELLASGYLLIKEYWPEGADTDKDGYKKVNEAESLLSMIMEGKIRLLDTNGKEFSSWAEKKEAAGLASIGATSGANIFSVNDKF